MWTTIRRTLLASWLALCFYSTAGIASEEKFTICIHPFKSASELVQTFTPLADYLSRSIGQTVEISVAPSYDAHVKAMGTEKFGIGYMGPASYLKLVETYGSKRLLARQAINGEPVFRGKIIVRKDNSVKSLAELAGKRFAFGDPDSTMSHLVPRYMLIEAGVGVDALAEYKFLGNHTNVALAVLSGSFDAGAVKEAVFYKYEERGLRALATTPALSEHLFVAGNRVPDAIVEKLKHALLTAHETPQGLAVLHAIKSTISAMVPVQDSDYDNLRAILATLKNHKVIQ